MDEKKKFQSDDTVKIKSDTKYTITIKSNLPVSHTGGNTFHLLCHITFMDGLECDAYLPMNLLEAVEKQLEYET